ncbi:MAG: PP2C family protein-serine/threonine phosphatase [Rhodothermaceae bacterium]
MIINFLSGTLIFSSVYFFTLYLEEVLGEKVKKPLSLVLNLGVCGAIVFFLVAVSSYFGEGDAAAFAGNVFIFLMVQILLVILIFSSAFILAAFKQLFFLGQKRSPEKIYLTMILFIILACISKFVHKYEPELEFPFHTFLSMAIVFISINSIRVSWIAFLTKRQKLLLLVLSVGLSILFGINSALFFQDGFISQSLELYIPGAEVFSLLVMLYGAIYFTVVFFTTLFHLPTAEAFDRKAEELSSFLDLSNLITQVFDFKELGETVVETTIRVCNSDAAWLVANNDGELELISAKNIGYVEAEHVSRSIIDENESTLRHLLSFTKNNIKFSHRTDVINSSLHTFVVAPLLTHKAIRGYLFAARKEATPFDEDDQKTIMSYADYAALTLENAKLIEESLEKERLEKELDVAREVQHKIIPIKTPQYDNLETSACFIPAFEVGGDYYDFFELPDEKLGFVIADVSGKGISAAFVMAEVKGVFETVSGLLDSPKEVLIQANRILNKSLDKKTFVTAIYGVFDRKKGTLRFARCGHPPLLNLRDGKIEYAQPNGLGLGLDFGKTFNRTIEEQELKLQNDDTIVIYTDGITEAKNSEMDDFGEQKLEDVILAKNNGSIDSLANEIMSAVSCYQKDTNQHDDITLVVFKWKNINNKAGEIND